MVALAVAAAPVGAGELRAAVAPEGAFRMLYGVPYWTGGARLRLGAESSRLAAYGELSVDEGGPIGAVSITHVLLGGTAEAILRWFRIGGGVRLGPVIVGRATESSPAMGVTVAIAAVASADLFKGDHFTLWLGVEADLELAIFPSPVLPNLSVGPCLAGLLGIRFGPERARAATSFGG
jgi:hypothetical protein